MIWLLYPPALGNSAIHIGAWTIGFVLLVLGQNIILAALISTCIVLLGFRAAECGASVASKRKNCHNGQNQEK
jgi:hypothetical protein